MRFGRLLAPLRWLVNAPPAVPAPPPPPPPPDPGPLVLELEPVYPNGATGALVRLTLGETEEARVPVPAGAAALRVRIVHRAGIYAGATLIADKPNELSTDEAVRLFRGVRR